ncbi:MAG: hypothetical protein WAQ53_17870 [Thiofilum sp.]|uniref:hypothetical protein n=1 Tax=Thiofilum sp. TaxID=2212733 RepID=UPI0025DFE4E7|nr:hypothetical protein [Thiofilum sp.]MBK8451984.1 hypothetical protein [Thiofilum sp.]
MTTLNQTPLIASRFSALEKQLEQLHRLIDNLASENEALRQREKQLLKTCQLLDQKNTKACAQIEAIIAQLKQQTPSSSQT